MWFKQFFSKIHFEEDGTKTYLVFQAMYRYFDQIGGVVRGNCIYSWKPKGFSDENITAPATTDYKINPELSFFVTKTNVEFNGSCLKQDKITCNHGIVVNIYIVYETSRNINISNYATLENCLFGAVSLTKMVDIDECIYSGCGIGFHRHGFYSHPSGETGRHIITFEVDMSSSTKIDNWKKDILILAKGPTQELKHTLGVQKMYSMNFTEHN